MWGGLLQDTVSPMGDMVHFLFTGEALCAMYCDVINIGLVAITWKGDIGNIRLVRGIVSLHVVLVSANEISRFLSEAG
jgi:hypothetical protein